MGGAKAHYDCIKVFSETDHTEDLKKITVPVLVMHSDDDQIVPFADAGPLSAKLLKHGTLKVYQGLPHACRRPMRTLSTQTFSPSSSHRALNRIPASSVGSRYSNIRWSPGNHENSDDLDSRK